MAQPGRERGHRLPLPPSWSDLRLRGKGSVLVAIPLVVFAIAAVLALVTLRNDGAAQSRVHHSGEVERQTEVVIDAVNRLGADQRAYAALGTPTYLSAIKQDDEKLTQELSALRTLVRDDSSQTGRVDSVRELLSRQPALPPTTSVRSSAQIGAWMEGESAVLASVQHLLDGVKSHEDNVLADRRASADLWRTVTAVSLVGLLVVGVLGGLLGVRLFTRSIARRVDRLVGELGEVDPGGAGPPDDSGDELGRLSRQLRATVRSLTHREDELRQARAFLDSILSVGPVVVLRAANGQPTYVSPNCERVLGVSAEDTLSLDFWAATAGAGDFGRLDEAAEQLFTPGAPEVVEYESVLTLGGRRRHLACLVTREADSAESRAVFLFLLDITDRRTAEIEGAQRQRELSAITAASPDIITVFGADLRVAFVSEAMTSILGQRVADRLGTLAGSSLHEDDQQLMVDAIRSVISGGAEDFTVRVRAWHAAGHYIVLEAHGRPLLGSAGEPVAAVAIFRDISDRIALEAALVEARDAADAASKAKSEFLSRMSHELRTPLNVVLGFAQLLQMEQLGEEQRSWVDQVLRAGRHLLDLINEVLDIARIESGRLTLSPEPVSLRDVIGETVESMRPLATAADVTLDFLIEGDDLFVQADRQRLKQVLLNLLANAVKYNKQHGSVLITSKSSSDAGGSDGPIVIRVSDTGVGIPPEHIERLFVPFDRLGAENSDVEGTGVGLPVSLRLVEAMAGSLSVESTPGEGSTFSVSLPKALRPDDGEHEAAIAAAERQMSEGGAGGAHGTLLYIEDNLTNVQLMQRLVERRPRVRLLHAFHGRIGLDLARTGHADVILLDLHLPDMTGLEVLSQLRSDPATSGVPVHIVSADATAGQVARMRAAGADGYLTKPLDVRRVLDLIDSILDDKVAARKGE